MCGGWYPRKVQHHPDDGGEGQERVHGNACSWGTGNGRVLEGVVTGRAEAPGDHSIRSQAEMDVGRFVKEGIVKCCTKTRERKGSLGFGGCGEDGRERWRGIGQELCAEGHMISAVLSAFLALRMAAESPDISAGGHLYVPFHSLYTFLKVSPMFFWVSSSTLIGGINLLPDSCTEAFSCQLESPARGLRGSFITHLSPIFIS